MWVQLSLLFVSGYQQRAGMALNLCPCGMLASWAGTSPTVLQCQAQSRMLLTQVWIFSFPYINSRFSNSVCPLGSRNSVLFSTEQLTQTAHRVWFQEAASRCQAPVQTPTDHPHHPSWIQQFFRMAHRAQWSSTCWLVIEDVRGEMGSQLDRCGERHGKGAAVCLQLCHTPSTRACP